jgi:hypothetical protein
MFETSVELRYGVMMLLTPTTTPNSNLQPPTSNLQWQWLDEYTRTMWNEPVMIQSSSQRVKTMHRSHSQVHPSALPMAPSVSQLQTLHNSMLLPLLQAA